MENNVYELTVAGKEELEKELENLKSVERPRNIEALKEARAQGDLSENADYDAAREEQRRIEGRIAEIEAILKNVKIIEATKDNGVSIGKTVKLIYTKLNREFTYEVVGTIEADPFNNKISNSSPLGKALLGHKKGDVISFTTEGGKTQEVKILAIK